MSLTFPEDLDCLTDMKVNLGRIVKHVTEAHRPVLPANRDRPIAVVQSDGGYEKIDEEQAYMRELIHPPFRTVYRRDPSYVRFVCVWCCGRLLRHPSADSTGYTVT